MSTRACIIKHNLNGTYSSIYNHSDGCPDGGLGEDLIKYYNDSDAVDTLISEGDCSYPGDPYSDGDSEAITCDSLEEILEAAKNVGYDYYYLFTNIMGEWYWYVTRPSEIKNGIEGWHLLKNYLEQL